MPLPKYPSNLEIIDRVSNFEDDHESRIRYDEEFPIMSVSKSFCGVVCVLMSIDGEFGENGIETTLEEILEKAKNTYPERTEKITSYLEMLSKTGFSDAKMSQLLNHTAGIADDYETQFQSYKNKETLEFFNDKLSGGSKPIKRGEYNYSNNGYALVEEIVNLASSSGSYKQELQDKIINKLDLSHTKILTDSEDAKNKVGEAVFLPGHKMGSREIEEPIIAKANEVHPLGQMPVAAAGLCSSINDIEKYSLELAKLITGQENSFTNQVDIENVAEKNKMAAKIYRNSYHNCFESEGGGDYSLGICLVPNEKQNLVINHRGGFDTNASMMRLETNCSFGDFLQEKEIRFQDSEIESKVFMQQHDCLTANLILPKSATIKDEMREFIKENYLDENGVINSKKIIEDFPSFNSIDKLVEELSKNKVDSNTKNSLDENLEVEEKLRSKFFEEIIMKNKKAKEAEDVELSWVKRVEKIM